ncbi:MAG TPA: hypothetical protein VIG29_13165 [Vicinamibacteria bacterium]|jgi:hypothetical protein
MKHRSIPFSTTASRRGFLSQTLLAAAALGAKPARARPSDPERERLARLLAKYGSELGDLRRIEGRE